MTSRIWESFGAELRDARRQCQQTQREVATRVLSSKSTISRLECGRLGSTHQDLLRRLDSLYETDGRFAEEYSRLVAPSWRTGTDLQRVDARRVWYHSYPSWYGGDVWLLVRPEGSREGADHSIHLDWGPWCRDLFLPGLGKEGALGVTGKAGRSPHVWSTPIRVHVEPKAHVIFGTDPEQTLGLEGAVMLHRGWHRADATCVVANRTILKPPAATSGDG